MFTLNNYKRLLDLDIPEIRYYVYQEEIGAEGTPHLQGYVEFANPRTLTGAKLLLGHHKLHLEIRKGTLEQAVAYCTKEDTRLDGPYTAGEPVVERQRTDLMAFKKDIDKGSSLQELWQEHFPVMMRYSRSVREYMSISIDPRRRVDPFVHLIVGAAGVGKTYMAEQLYPTAYMKGASDWWTSYKQERTVVLNDFKGWLKYSTWLHLCDTNRFYAEVDTKGAQVRVTADVIVITSSMWPHHWWEKGNKAEIARRINYITIIHDDRRVDGTECYATFERLWAGEGPVTEVVQ